MSHTTRFACIVLAAAVFSDSRPVEAVCTGCPGEPVEWNGGTYDVSMLTAVVTSDGNGTHATSPGVAAFGVDHDGVGDLLIENTGDAVYDGRCTASLLSLGGRQWAISAAHCLTDGSGNLDATSLRLEFELGTGSVFSYATNANNFHIHPSWNGSATSGYDIALIQLDAVADSGVPSYLLNRNTNELDADEVVHIGFGNKGDGATGQDAGTSGTKRAGLKLWEEFGLGNRGVGGISNNDTMLTDDFDSGNATNDGFNFFFGDPQDLGFGDDEVGVSQGDSGGPSFIEDDGVWKIAGIHSHGLRLATTGGASSDVDSSLNFSWGEFGVDARVAQADVINWIDTTIPEPGSALLLIVGLGMLGVCRHRRNGAAKGDSR